MEDAAATSFQPQGDSSSSSRVTEPRKPPKRVLFDDSSDDEIEAKRAAAATNSYPVYNFSVNPDDYHDPVEKLRMEGADDKEHVEAIADGIHDIGDLVEDVTPRDVGSGVVGAQQEDEQTILKAAGLRSRVAPDQSMPHTSRNVAVAAAVGARRGTGISDPILSVGEDAVTKFLAQRDGNRKRAREITYYKREAAEEGVDAEIFGAGEDEDMPPPQLAPGTVKETKEGYRLSLDPLAFEDLQAKSFQTQYQQWKVEQGLAPAVPSSSGLEDQPSENGNGSGAGEGEDVRVSAEEFNSQLELSKLMEASKAALDGKSSDAGLIQQSTPNNTTIAAGDKPGVEDATNDDDAYEDEDDEEDEEEEELDELLVVASVEQLLKGCEEDGDETFQPFMTAAREQLERLHNDEISPMELAESVQPLVNKLRGVVKRKLRPPKAENMVIDGVEMDI